MQKVQFYLMSLLVFWNCQCYAQSFEKNNSYAFNAMKQAIDEFRKHERLPRKFRIIKMKIISLDERKGEFVLSTITYQREYDTLNPSHYIDDEDGPILIKADSALKINLDEIGIKQTNDNIKAAVKAVLAGPHPTIPGLVTSVTGQDPGYMIFNYKRRKINGNYCPGQLPDKKYYF